MDRWGEGETHPSGHFVREVRWQWRGVRHQLTSFKLGRVGDVDVEVQALLIEHDMNPQPFPPVGDDWVHLAWIN